MEKDARRQNTAKGHPIYWYEAEYSDDDELDSTDHEDDLAEPSSNGTKYSVATSKSHTKRAGTKKPPRKPAAPTVPEYHSPFELDRYDTFRSEKDGVPPGATYFNNQVFEEVFPRLGKNPWKRDTEAFYRFPPRPVVPRTNKPHLQIVYTAVYSACFHKMKKMVKLSVMDISRRTGIDWRTVQLDLFWLTQSGDIEVVKEGRSKARRSGEKTLWSVPLATFDMRKQHFTPVPKFVVDHYVPVYPRAILLPVLQYIRQWRRYNGYWVERVGDTTGWPKRTIYRVLKELGDQHKWGGKKDTDPDVIYHLPCPIEVREQRFHLRYLNFHGYRGRSIQVVREFAEEFGSSVHTGYRSC
jgi:hypothetical protein